MQRAGGTTSSKRVPQRGAVLLGLASGMLLVAGGFGGAYYVLGTKSEANAATVPAPIKTATATATPTPAPTNTRLDSVLAKTVDVKIGTTSVALTWGELGITIDPTEAARASDLTALTLDRAKSSEVLRALKGKHDITATNAYLDLEEKKIFDEVQGLGIDVWGSMPRILTAARAGAPAIELAMVPMPARVTKATLGIDDISHVLGHYTTRFPVTDRDRNFNLKLAASKVNGSVLAPGAEWSFNGTVGERSEKEGYKIAHVITAGEMVDGLAGGTCQISTTLFGASFFAGLEIVKTTNHSRPSAYTPLGFDATVVWPNTDLKLKNPYPFPVVLHYRVANGEAVVEVLGKERPYSKVVFERQVLPELTTPYSIEERIDEKLPEGYTSIDQGGFNGYTLERRRKFYDGKKLVKTEKWKVVYKPVTEYVRRGTNPDPEAKTPPDKGDMHKLKEPTSDEYAMSQ